MKKTQFSVCLLNVPEEVLFSCYHAALEFSRNSSMLDETHVEIWARPVCDCVESEEELEEEDTNE